MAWHGGAVWHDTTRRASLDKSFPFHLNLLRLLLGACGAVWSRPAPPSCSSIRSNLRRDKLVQTDDWWMSSDRRRICSAVNYSAPPRSISTSLREVWGPLASPLSAASSCSASAELSVTPARRSDGWRRALGQSYSAATEPQIEAFCRSTGVPGSPPRSLPKFWLIPSAPLTICPLISHLFKHRHPTSEQLQPSHRCHSLAFSMKKLYDSEGSSELIIPHRSPHPFFFPSFDSFSFLHLALISVQWNDHYSIHDELMCKQMVEIQPRLFMRFIFNKTVCGLFVHWRFNVAY